MYNKRIIRPGGHVYKIYVYWTTATHCFRSHQTNFRAKISLMWIGGDLKFRNVAHWFFKRWRPPPDALRDETNPPPRPAQFEGVGTRGGRDVNERPGGIIQRARSRVLVPPRPRVGSVYYFLSIIIIITVFRYAEYR